MNSYCLLSSDLPDRLIDCSVLSVLQIFVGKIPRDLFEDELVPLFEKAGPIWDLRLMMDPLSGLNRGYAFLTFCTKEAAQEAVKLVRHANPCRSIHDAVPAASVYHVSMHG